MEKVLAFESPRGHYDADACIVWCFDDRFSGLLDAFVKQHGFKKVDVVESAGGAKALASGSPAERDFILNQVKLSISLHNTRRLVLMLHMDCGGFGGSKNFNNDRGKEEQYLAMQLNDATNVVKPLFKNLEIELFIADFDGLYKV